MTTGSGQDADFFQHDIYVSIVEVPFNKFDFAIRKSNNLTNNYISTGCSLNIVVFFSRLFNILRPLPRQNWAAIGCIENGQPIKVTVYTQISYQMSCSPTCWGGWDAVK